MSQAVIADIRFVVGNRFAIRDGLTDLAATPSNNKYESRFVELLIVSEMFTWLGFG